MLPSFLRQINIIAIAIAYRPTFIKDHILLL